MAKRLPLAKQIETELNSLANVPGWLSEMALALATEFDAEPTAALAHQLRQVMDQIHETAPAAKQETTTEELKRKREERRASTRTNSRRAKSS